MRGPYHIALLGAVLLGLPGCGPTTRILTRDPGPAAEVRRVRCSAFSPQRTELEIELALAAQDEELRLERVDYSVLVDGRPFAVGIASIDVSVPAAGRAALTVPVRLSHLDWPQRVKTRARQAEPVVVVARGALRGRAGEKTVALDFAGETAAMPSAAEAPEEP